MKNLLIALCVICIIIPFVVYGVAIAKAVGFEANCVDYFELAANANSVELAEKHLTAGIQYLEKNNLTNGCTKIMVYKPANDIGIWYENLTVAQKQLRELNLKSDLTELEESNALMKLRETLLDSEGNVNHPDLISFYPNHTAWFWWMILVWGLWAVALWLGFAIWWRYL